MHHLPNVSGPLFYSSFFFFFSFRFLFFFPSPLFRCSFSNSFLSFFLPFFSLLAIDLRRSVYLYSLSSSCFFLSFSFLFSSRSVSFIYSSNREMFYSEGKGEISVLPPFLSSARFLPERRTFLLFAFLTRPDPLPFLSLSLSLSLSLPLPPDPSVSLHLPGVSLRLSLSATRGRNNGDTCPRSEASHMNGSFIRCNGVL